MKKRRKIILFIITTVIVYICLYGFYMLMSIGIPDKTIYLQMRRYVPCAIAVTATFFLWKQCGLDFKKLLPHAFVGLAWILVFPLCYWLTFRLNTSFIDNHYDIAFGGYVFACTASLRVLLSRFLAKKDKVAATILAVLHTALLGIPLLQLWYFINYQSPITEAGAMALIQTNESEAKEFILLNVGYAGIGAIIVACFIILFLFYRLNRLHNTASALTRPLVITAVIITLATGFYSHKIFEETGVMNKYLNAKNYFELSSLFYSYHDENFAELQVTKPAKTFAKPSTIIMVIGESATRYYMSAYGYDEHDTTPWMRQMASTPEFVLFKHAYSSWGQTVPSLERALTEKNQYNDKEFNQSVTLIDLAKKAGYTTYWFSNQGTMGGADTPITMVAKTADHSAFIEDTLANTSEMKYDEDLIPYLSQVNPNENNFIILHIMGSHDNYINRYPPEFTRWGTPNVYEPITDYDNSLAYTDQFLKDVFTYGREHLNLQAMVYFSDHGTDPRYKRHPDTSSFISLRIPLFLYISDEYQQLYPQTASALKSHSDSYFTNDLTYELIAGLLNIKSNRYDETNSLASPEYSYTRDTLVTRLGQFKLSDDKEES